MVSMYELIHIVSLFYFYLIYYILIYCENGNNFNLKQTIDRNMSHAVHQHRRVVQSIYKSTNKVPIKNNVSFVSFNLFHVNVSKRSIRRLQDLRSPNSSIDWS